MKKIITILFLILALGIILRFYNLGNVPNGFHRDEAFLAYNGYSIFKTGKDMAGIFLPLHLKTFLYTPAGYSYFSIPFIFLFGLNEFSARFASAFFGVLTILVTYFLAVEIYRACKFNKFLKFQPEVFGLASSFFLCISPWHINLSRTASVITLVVFFITLGIYLFLKWSENRKVLYYVFSLVSFLISLFFYISPYIFLPFLIISLFIIFDRKNDYKGFSLKAIFVIVLLTPIILSLYSSTISLRARSLSITNHDEVTLVLDEKIREDGIASVSTPLARVFHNKIVGYSSKFLETYASHFSYPFLFTDKGFPERYKVPLMGLLYVTDLLFILVGAFLILKNFTWSRVFLLIWILLVPIGSSMTQDDVPNLQRTLYIFPALSLVIALGFLVFIGFLKSFRIYTILLAALIVVFTYQFFFYLHSYYIHSMVYRPWYRNYGYKELVVETNKLLPKYKNAVVTNRESAPAIFFLFYSKYDPSKYLEETKEKFIKDYDRENFGKYLFSLEECPLRVETNSSGGLKAIGNKSVLYINSGLCRKNDKTFKVLKEINRTDNSAVFDILIL